MTINQKIIKALKPLGVPVTSDFFGGGNSEYITFNYVKDGAELFADNQPVEDISLMQIHYFLPSTKDFLEAKRKIRRVILEEGGTYPDVTVLMEPDNKTRHIVFESLRKESKVVQTKKQYGDFSLTALSFASISIFSG